jgi:hypothetical protein
MRLEKRIYKSYSSKRNVKRRLKGKIRVLN